MRWGGLAALAPAAAALPISRRSWGESLRFAMLQPPRFGIATSMLAHLTKSEVDAPASAKAAFGAGNAYESQFLRLATHVRDPSRAGGTKIQKVGVTGNTC